MDKKNLDRLEYKRQFNKKKASPELPKETMEVIARRKSKQKERYIRRTIFFLIITLILLIALFLSPIFKIKKINFKNNYYMNLAKVNKKIEPFIGRSIFIYNKNELINLLKEDPYVEDAKVSAKSNGDLDITVSEFNKDFFIQTTEGYLIVNKNMKILENVSEKPENILEIVDEVSASKVGNNLNLSKEKINYLKEYIDLMNNNTSTVFFSTVDLSNFSDIKMTYKDIQVLMGDERGLKEKLNKAINIIKKPEVISTKGTINLKYDSNPTFVPEKNGVETNP